MCNIEGLDEKIQWSHSLGFRQELLYYSNASEMHRRYGHEVKNRHLSGSQATGHGCTSHLQHTTVLLI